MQKYLAVTKISSTFALYLKTKYRWVAQLVQSTYSIENLW